MSPHRRTLVQLADGELVPLEDCPADWRPEIHWDVNERPERLDAVLCAWHPSGKAFFPYYLEARPSDELLKTLITALTYDATRRLRHHRGVT